MDSASNTITTTAIAADVTTMPATGVPRLPTAPMRAGSSPSRAMAIG